MGLRPTAGTTPTVDPAALPGDGARVVPRPAGAARRAADDEAGDDGEEQPSQGGAERYEQGEAFRGR